MMRRLAINLLGFIIAVFRVMRRRKVSSAIPAVIAEPVREARTVEWCRSQPTINSDTLIDAVQKVRGTITHCGAVAARTELDRLQRLAEQNPEGVPGVVVADSRLQFDSLMRANLQ